MVKLGEILNFKDFKYSKSHEILKLKKKEIYLSKLKRKKKFINKIQTFNFPKFKLLCYLKNFVSKLKSFALLIKKHQFLDI